MRRQTILPFKIEQADVPLMAWGGLVLPYEMAEALRLPEVIDRELLPPGSGRGYKPSRFVLYQVAGAMAKHAHQVLLKLAAPIDKIALLHKFRRRCFMVAYS